jgi:hypothetical protein
MRLLAALALSATAVGMAGAMQGLQITTSEPVRIKIRHADPWAVKAMLDGQPLVSPELSTVFNLLGMPPAAAQGVNSFFTGGHLIVNPTDNSLWFYPDKK